MVQTLISSTSSGEAYDKEEYVFTPYAKMLDQFALDYGNTDKYDYSTVEKSLLQQTPPTTSVGKITATFAWLGKHEGFSLSQGWLSPGNSEAILITVLRASHRILEALKHWMKNIEGHD